MTDQTLPRLPLTDKRLALYAKILSKSNFSDYFWMQDDYEVITLQQILIDLRDDLQAARAAIRAIADFVTEVDEADDFSETLDIEDTKDVDIAVGYIVSSIKRILAAQLPTEPSKEGANSD